MITLPIEMPRSCVDCPFMETDLAPRVDLGKWIYEKYARCKWQDFMYDKESSKHEEDDIEWESKFDPTLPINKAIKTRMEYCPLIEIED